jgi:hypothetical protein
MMPITEETLSNLPPHAPAFLIGIEFLKNIEENYPIYINAAFLRPRDLLEIWLRIVDWISKSCKWPFPSCSSY